MSAAWFDEWADEQDRLGEHMWLEMRGVFRDPEPYPDDDWDDGYNEWLEEQLSVNPFSDLTEDDEASRWLAEHDPDR